MKNILIKLDHDKWKVQLGMPTNFISSIDNDEDHVMHSKSDNIEIMINYQANEVTENLFDSLKNRYQINLKSIKDCQFVFDYVHLL